MLKLPFNKQKKDPIIFVQNVTETCFNAVLDYLSKKNYTVYLHHLLKSFYEHLYICKICQSHFIENESMESIKWL